MEHGGATDSEQPLVEKRPFWEQFYEKRPWWWKYTEQMSRAILHSNHHQVMSARNFVSFLTKEQLDQYTESGRFSVIDKKGREWVLAPGYSPETTADGRRYCSYAPWVGVTDWDLCIAQLFYIRTRPSRYMKLKR